MFCCWHRDLTYAINWVYYCCHFACCCRCIQRHHDDRGICFWQNQLLHSNEYRIVTITKTSLLRHYYMSHLRHIYKRFCRHMSRWLCHQTYVLMELFSSCHPCRQQSDWPWLPSSFSSYFLSSPFSNCVLYQQSPTPIFTVFLRSPLSLSISLLPQFSDRILGLPRVLFPFTFRASDLFSYITI